MGVEESFIIFELSVNNSLESFKDELEIISGLSSIFVVDGDIISKSVELSILLFSDNLFLLEKEFVFISELSVFSFVNESETFIFSSLLFLLLSLVSVESCAICELWYLFESGIFLFLESELVTDSSVTKLLFVSSFGFLSAVISEFW